MIFGSVTASATSTSFLLLPTAADLHACSCAVPRRRQKSKVHSTVCLAVPPTQSFGQNETPSCGVVFLRCAGCLRITIFFATNYDTRTGALTLTCCLGVFFFPDYLMLFFFYDARSTIGVHLCIALFETADSVKFPEKEARLTYKFLLIQAHNEDIILTLA